MKQVLTLVIKLQPNPEHNQLLDDTAQAFADACNYINKTVKRNLTNRNSIQAVCYQDVKERFGLTANHVVRACARVGANRLTAKQKGRKVKASTTLSFNTERSRGVKKFKPTSFDCDTRTFRFIETGYLASISTTGKRAKIPMRVSNYHIGKLSGQNLTSAQVCQHKDGDWYVHIQLKSDAPKPIKADNVIGVDFGRRDIAVTSTNKSWSGKEIQEKRDKFNLIRASLQKKADATPRRRTAQGNAHQAASQGTRSTRRRCRQILKRLSGRERRYQAWINHNISKAIIDEAKQTQSFVSIEDLTGIRERTNQQPRNKTEASQKVWGDSPKVRGQR
ncbi:transposase, partial [Crocosphaera sp. Alani8]|uniref:transposase n=1 Tax=Crocosphaera sp. Alani8 TaxID=3038952 RepID=UPI00313E6140